MLEESNVDMPAAAAEGPPQRSSEGSGGSGGQQGRSVTTEMLGVWNRLYSSSIGKARSGSGAADSTEEQAEQPAAEADAGEGRKSESGNRNYWESAQNMLRTSASSLQKYSAQVATATRSAAESAYHTVSVQSSVVYNTAKSTLDSLEAKIGDLEAKLHSPAENLTRLADGLAYDNLMQEEGAIELSIPPTAVHSQMSVVPRNCTIQWKFCIKSKDLGFAVRRRVQEMGGAVEEDIHELKRYQAGEVVTGDWKAEDGKDHALVFVWDNKHSKIRPKTFVYKVRIYPPGAQVPSRSASNTPPPSTNLAAENAPVAATTASSTAEEVNLLDIPPHTAVEQTAETFLSTSLSGKDDSSSNNNNDANGDEEEDDNEEILLADISLPRSDGAEDEA